jgi:adenosine deaminase
MDPPKTPTSQLRHDLQVKARSRSPLNLPTSALSSSTTIETKTLSTSTSNTNWCTDDFLAAIPKSDIHVHLDGSLRLETLIELARDAPNISLPTEDIKELRRTIFKPSYNSLEEYLSGFMYTCGVMQTAANLERVSYEFAFDNFTENVRYFEVRFAPQLHGSIKENGMSIIDVLTAVNAGLQRAQNEFNSILRKDRENGTRITEPHYSYGIIVCAMRMFFPGMSSYYDALFKLHPHASASDLTAMASVNLVQAAKIARDHHNIPVVALDIAGAEKDNEATIHVEAFKLAHQYQFAKTVHAGEGFGPESIWQAIRDLHAERIGHGFHISSSDQVIAKKNLDSNGSGKEFCTNLIKYVSDRRITMEVCLTSNLNTMPGLTIDKHALKGMIEGRLSVTLSTDNKLISDTNMLKELKLAVHTFGLSPKQLKELVITGYKRSFYHGPYTERREYVRKVMDWYDEVATQFSVPLK